MKTFLISLFKRDENGNETPFSGHKRSGESLVPILVELYKIITNDDADLSDKQDWTEVEVVADFYVLFRLKGFRLNIEQI